MKTLHLPWFCIFLAATKSQSLTTDQKSENSLAVVCANQSSDHEMNNLRQQLNQETIIRLSLTRQVYSLVDDMITMKKHMAKMEARVQEVEKKEHVLQLENQRLQRQLDKYLRMNNSIGENSAQIRKIKNDLFNFTSIMDAVSNGTYKDKRVVVFNAAVSNTLNLQRNTPVNVVYDTVLYQTGDVYNPRNGFFTAPSGGLYVFSWTTLVAAHKIFDAELLVNGQRKGLGNCNNEANPGYENCACTIPVVLKFGDEVNIRTTTANYIHGNHWSSFKGWKVW
ncbi:uncharacterized protein LOC133203843 isoform X1 [Saccostrea echinata]|uniref:uncharacterized protein LOC133203843 isoform X1 n=1 Tax=Saccostrea echinata TaxID=191078 RepID=UPI002A7FD5C2|nr:uncharacterized protein LOC133203843 isoform X1 [Saccostrea echinata]